MQKNKIDKSSNESTTLQEWSLLDLDLTEVNFGPKMTYDKESNFMTTHSIFRMDHVKYIEDLFESLQGYGKFVLLMVFKKGNEKVIEFCFLEKDIIVRRVK